MDSRLITSSQAPIAKWMGREARTSLPDAAELHDQDPGAGTEVSNLTSENSLFDKQPATTVNGNEPREVHVLGLLRRGVVDRRHLDKHFFRIRTLLGLLRYI